MDESSNIKAEIEHLRKEWDRLDSTGACTAEITERIDALNRKLAGAPPENPALEQVKVLISQYRGPERSYSHWVSPDAIHYKALCILGHQMIANGLTDDPVLKDYITSVNVIG